MQQVFDLLASFSELREALYDITQRSHPIQLATVTDVRPEDRHIRVTREAQGGQVQTDWFPAGRSNMHTDEPLPKTGTTVLIAAVEGNPHDFYLVRTLPNETNPVDDRQENPSLDHTEGIPGDRRLDVGKDSYRKIGGDETAKISGKLEILASGGEVKLRSHNGTFHIEATDNIIIRNDKGASITLFEDGSILLRSAAGVTFRIGRGGQGCTWDMNGQSINIINAAGFSISGQQIATVNAQDSRGDLLVDRGW